MSHTAPTLHSTLHTTTQRVHTHTHTLGQIWIPNPLLCPNFVLLMVAHSCYNFSNCCLFVFTHRQPLLILQFHNRKWQTKQTIFCWIIALHFLRLYKRTSINSFFHSKPSKMSKHIFSFKEQFWRFTFFYSSREPLKTVLSHTMHVTDRGGMNGATSIPKSC